MIKFERKLAFFEKSIKQGKTIFKKKSMAKGKETEESSVEKGTSLDKG
jgi:hypothetical protein